MLTAAQLRAARGLLDWTRADLAKAANISPETIKNIEHGTFRPQEATTEAIIRAFSARDVAFIEGDGVRRVTGSIRTYQGAEDFRRFMDEIYESARTISGGEGTDGSICVSNVDNALFKKHLGDFAEAHVKRMIALRNVHIRAIAAAKDMSHDPDAGYLVYRYSTDIVSSVPFYVYGDKLAIINFQVENAPSIVIINSALVAASFRAQFDIMWQNAAERPLR